MWKSKSVSVIFPTYREKKSIRNVIREFDSSGFVDEIIVVDNNAEEGTEREIRKTRAKIIKEKKQGYGYAVSKGIESAKSDLIIVAEPDGSYDGKDVAKLLTYSDDFDIVFGSRTYLPSIEKDSDMIPLKRLGDIFCGKLITLLFYCPPLTDFGCTLRITTKKGWKKVEEELRPDDKLFAGTWLLVAAKNKVNFVEIPIHYRARVGKSLFVSKPFTQGAVWGVRKISLILKVWFYKIFNKKL